MLARCLAAVFLTLLLTAPAAEAAVTAKVAIGADLFGHKNSGREN